jgi:hypothetical protein
MADRALACARGHTREVIDLAQNLVRFVYDPLSSLREPDLSFCPVEEFDAEFFLQLPDLLAQGRLADVQPYSRPAEMEFLGDGDEVAQVP